tara:strand:- start:47571 stop:48095 length:525 start_codon:yes stop_codon:yes gene_type:complete
MSQQDEDYMSRTALGAELTRTELAMIRAIEAFSRWGTVLHKAVANAHLSYRDIAVLHAIRMCGNAQNLSELMMFLNRNDVSTLQYSLKKLEQEALVQRVTGKSKREAGYVLTEAGLDATERYSAVREEILLTLLEELRDFGPRLEAASSAIERLSGAYDQAAQTVMNRRLSGKS